MNDDEADWFAPKLFGFGPGIPVSWRGWALILGFVAICVGDGLLFAQKKPLVFVALLIPFTAVFIVIACRRTRGGCHWRWRGEE